MFRICMVSRHGCIRVLKESLALLNRGYQVDHIAAEVTFGFNRFTTQVVYDDRDQLRRAVEINPADIFHVHNEPDWIVAATKEGAGSRPVIYDIHDLESMRWGTEPNADENAAFDCANGLVHVSGPCRAAAEKFHGNGKPSIILPPFVNDEFVPKYAGDVSWGTLVYQGGLSTHPPINEERHTFNMRSLQPVVGEFVQQGFNVQIYTAKALEDDFTYENLGAVVVGPLPYTVMLRALRPYGFGFVGAAMSTPLMEAAAPNKMYEYISQGVVPVFLNAGYSGNWAAENGVGIVLDGLDNLFEQLREAPAIRMNILKERHNLTMEKAIQPLIDLYEAVL